MAHRTDSAPDISESLSPFERRIAAYVAAGMSNRDIAAQVFLSPRTIECHLSRIYARIGVGSRYELARALGPIMNLAVLSPMAESLTDREAQVVAIVVEGGTNRRVAEALGISIRTVENHLVAAYRKLGIRTRVQLVASSGVTEATCPGGRRAG